MVEHLPPTQASHQCGLSFDSQTRRHMWVEFVVGSRPCSGRFFSGYSGFLLSSKTNTSKFQFDVESEGHKFISLGLLRATLVEQRLFIYFIYLYFASKILTFNGVCMDFFGNCTLQTHNVTSSQLAQLVEHCTGIAEVMGFNPVQALIIFRLSLCNCFSCVNNYMDLSSFILTLNKLKNGKVTSVCRCRQPY